MHLELTSGQPTVQPSSSPTYVSGHGHLNNRPGNYNVCVVGFYSTDGRLCTPCPVNHFSSRPGSSSGEQCPSPNIAVGEGNIKCVGLHIDASPGQVAGLNVIILCITVICVLFSAWKHLRDITASDMLQSWAARRAVVLAFSVHQLFPL